MGPENIFKDHEEREKWLMRSKNFKSDVWVTVAMFFFLILQKKFTFYAR